MATRKTRKKTFRELKKQLFNTATELLKYRHGGYDGDSNFCTLNSHEADALNAAIAAVSDSDLLLSDLRKRVLKDIKDLEEDSVDYKAIVGRGSVLTLFRWIENSFDDAATLFDSIEQKTERRCEIEEWLVEIIDELR
jgi:hypothetical protein